MSVTIRKYVVGRVDTSWGKPLSQAKAESRILELSGKSNGPFRVRYAHDKRWGPKLIGLKELRPKVANRLEHLDMGDALLVDNRQDFDQTVRCRIVLTKDDPLDLVSCTESCEVIIWDLRREFPHHLNLGWFSCRRILGSSSWSQHAYGNAYDAGGPFTLLKAIAAHAIAKAKAGNLPVAQVIFNRQVWTPSSGLQPYSGSDPHTGHVHITARPEMSGTPLCAR
jgi:hypothetical protein